MKTLEERRAYLKDRYPVWQKRTIYELFAKAAQEYPDRLLYEDCRSAFTYSQTLAMTEKAASAFRRMGLQRGDRVGLNLNNRIEFLVVTFALAAIGAVKIPVNRKVTIEQKSFILNETQAVLYITDKQEEISCVHKCSSLQKVLLLGEVPRYERDAFGWQAFTEGLIQWQIDRDLCTSMPQYLAPAPGPSPDDLCDVIFTSGSTGNPKGVMLTHDMMLRCSFANCLNRGFHDGRKILTTVPLFHVFGYIKGLLAVLFVGGTLVCMQGKFDVGKALYLIQEKKIQDILCVPSLMQSIVTYPSLESFHLDSFFAAYSAASSCPEWVWKAAYEKLGLKEIITGYGMTEVSGAPVQSPPEAPFERLCHHVGKVLQDHFKDAQKLAEYKVVDPDTLKELPPGQDGELICRGAVVTKGYFANEQATQELFTPDGWLRSGDEGNIDEEGYVTFQGRMNDCYKINGENVSPHYLDQIIAGCRDIVQVQTVGVPDEKLGWVGVAFIETADDYPHTKDKIINYCQENLASYQVPKYYFFLKAQEWPRSPVGKITKKMLRQMAIQKLGQNT